MASTSPLPHTVDLVVGHADLLVTMDSSRREIAGGWVAIDAGAVVGVGDTSTRPPATRRTIDASGCVVTPGFVNTHHHIYQNLTRSFSPALQGDLFHWLTTLYPVWSRLDEEAAYVSAYIGAIELAMGGCTTSTDHLYVHPRGAGDLIGAEIAGAAEVGLRFHPTRGSMSRSRKDGGLPPEEVVQDDDEILADCERLVDVHHDRSPLAMVRIGLAPCSPFSATPELMRSTAELAARLDVRLHTHLAEDRDEDAYCAEMYHCRPVEHLEACGWMSDRTWVAHCVFPSDVDIANLGANRVGIAHCPSSNQLIGAGLAPITEMRAAGSPVGLGCDGSASTDCASLWMEARAALLLGRLRGGPRAMAARDALEMATLGGAACLGRTGEIGTLSVGACGDLVVWPRPPVAFAGAWSDPVEALLRCGPLAAKTTVVAGRVLVDDGEPTAPMLDMMLRTHRRISKNMQAALV